MCHEFFVTLTKDCKKVGAKKSFHFQLQFQLPLVKVLFKVTKHLFYCISVNATIGKPVV
jgi:hypothetical protein